MKQSSKVIALATAVVILGGVLLLSQRADSGCCASPEPSPLLTQGDQSTAAPASASEVALLFDYFQLNGTTGTLLVVMQNVGGTNTSVSTVYFDGSEFNNSFVMPSEACASFIIGSECSVTLAFGPESVLPPAQGTVHSFIVQTARGDRFEYSVTAGAGGANCGLAHC